MDLADLALRDLQAVATVAAEGHFGRAAGRLGISQSTLTVRVQKVERAVRAVLFERALGRFIVTAAGKRLLPVIHDTSAAAAGLSAGAPDGHAASHPAALRLGVIPTLGPYLIPHLLDLPGRRRRGPALAVTEQRTADLVAMVESGELDAALVSVPLLHARLAFIPLFDEPFLLAARRGSEVLAIRPLSPARLRACDMVLLEDGHCLRDQALAVCGRRGGPRPRLVATSLETLKYMVAAGDGYSLLPLLACDLSPSLAPHLRAQRFDANPPQRRIGLCYRRTFANPELLDAFNRHALACLPPGLVPCTVHLVGAPGVPSRALRASRAQPPRESP